MQHWQAGRGVSHCSDSLGCTARNATIDRKGWAKGQEPTQAAT
jgi:hypothetical protein